MTLRKSKIDPQTPPNDPKEFPGVKKRCQIDAPLQKILKTTRNQQCIIESRLVLAAHEGAFFVFVCSAHADTPHKLFGRAPSATSVRIAKLIQNIDLSPHTHEPKLGAAVSRERSR